MALNKTRQFIDSMATAMQSPWVMGVLHLQCHRYRCVIANDLKTVHVLRLDFRKGRA